MNSVERVKSICREKKIPISKLERDLGYSNGYIGQLRKGVFPTDRLVDIANYLNVSTDYLLTGEETKKAPTQEGERSLDDEDLKVAYFRGADPTLTKEDMDAMWEDARAFRDFIVAKRKKEKEKNGG